jgi:hypothetical protein
VHFPAAHAYIILSVFGILMIVTLRHIRKWAELI